MDQNGSISSNSDTGLPAFNMKQTVLFRIMSGLCEYIQTSILCTCHKLLFLNLMNIDMILSIVCFVECQNIQALQRAKCSHNTHADIQAKQCMHSMTSTKKSNPTCRIYPSPSTGQTGGLVRTQDSLQVLVIFLALGWIAFIIAIFVIIYIVHSRKNKGNYVQTDTDECIFGSSRCSSLLLITLYATHLPCAFIPLKLLNLSALAHPYSKNCLTSPQTILPSLILNEKLIKTMLRSHLFLIQQLFHTPHLQLSTELNPLLTHSDSNSFSLCTE